MLTAVKFCGLCRPADAAAAVAAGGRYAGVILSRAGPRAQSREAASAIFRAAAGAIRVGVFVDEPVPLVQATAEALGLGVVQLHGSEPPETVAALRGAGPWRVWKAIRPRDSGEFLAGLGRWSSVVDGFLLDGWSAGGAGGTGTRFPLEAVEMHRERVPAGIELVAAGGLGPESVGEIVMRLRPDVVDVSSGVETEPRVKSAALMNRFAAAVRAADRQREESDGESRGAVPG